MEKKEYQKMFLLENQHFWFVGKRFYIKTILNKYLLIYPKKILDIGSGTGGLTSLLCQYGFVIGLEKNPYAIQLAKKRKLNIIKGDAQDIPFSSSSFDLITVFDVLYHRQIKNVEKVIKEAARVLKRGGFLLITDSAYEFLKSNHDNALHGQRRFTLNQLSSILEKNNFKIIKASYLYFVLLPLIFIKRKILDKISNKESSDVKPVNFFINKLLTKIIFLEAWLLNFINFPFGSSLIILGKKL